MVLLLLKVLSCSFQYVYRDPLPVDGHLNFVINYFIEKSNEYNTYRLEKLYNQAKEITGGKHHDTQSYFIYRRDS